jgi:ATP-dependent Clp protease ATP-binding subunit ClpA
VIQKELINELSKKIISGEVSNDNNILVTNDDRGELSFKNSHSTVLQ